MYSGRSFDQFALPGVDALNGLQPGLIRIGTFSGVATHWLPKAIQEFQKDYPNIDYELLLGDYREIEQWILEGRVDCGFLCLPVRPELENLFLARDRKTGKSGELFWQSPLESAKNGGESGARL